MRDQGKADELENRLIDFAVRVIKLADVLPKTPVGKHIARQLLRSGTSAAPNYAEARGAESNKDFVHKLKNCLERTQRNERLAKNRSACQPHEGGVAHRVDRRKPTALLYPQRIC